MNKYNNIKSIPIESLSKDELPIAIKEWAEGNANMEKLLWALYDKGIKTNGCHVGTASYIGLEYEPDKKDAISNFMSSILLVRGLEVSMVPDGGNPNSGPDWYKPIITIISNTDIESVANDQFELITNILNDNTKVPNGIDLKPIIDLLDFFIDKYTGVYFRINHDDDSYSIEFHAKRDNRELYNYFNNNFSSLGFNGEEMGLNGISWNFNTNNINQLNEKLKEVSSNLIENYSLETPTDPYQTDSFIAKAHLLRKKSPDEFNEWLEEENKKTEEILENLRKNRKK